MKKLRELRLKFGLTTTELGKAIGCSNPTITNYELGNRKPDPDMLIKLANYFNVSIDYLLGRDTITPAERAAGWVDTKKVSLSPEEDDWLTKRDEILRLYGNDGLQAVTAMIDTYINAKR